MFFSYLERCMNIFSCKCSPLNVLQQIATASLQKAFTNLYCKSTRHSRCSMLLAIGACALVFYITRTMIGRNITNHSFEEKKSALLLFIWQQHNFLSRVFALKVDKFVLKVKPKKKSCSITPQELAKQYPGKFHADNNLLFCSTYNVIVDHHQKPVLDKHLSAVSHIKRMDESSSK